MARDTSRDGFGNEVQTYVLTHFGWFWRLLQRSRRLSRAVNKALINSAIYKIPTRPFAFSLMTLDAMIPGTQRPKGTATYTSWQSLIDRTYTGRHLPPDPQFTARLPDIDRVVDLFRRRNGPIASQKSTLLFPYFVQWFTDGFLRTASPNRLMNTSNHHIDLSPVYGLTPQSTNMLRSFAGGTLKSQTINGEEYPEYYYDAATDAVKPEFAGLYTPLNDEARLPREQRAQLFAMGVERANVQVGYVMMNVLCLREHNRLCALLAQAYPDWDDERLFQTARNILMVVVMKVVVEEYINHIAPYEFKFITDPMAFINERWYRQNWMTVEFTLVYRWHSALPPTATYAGSTRPMAETLWNNAMLTQRGLGVMFEETSAQPAGRIGLHNTDDALVDAAEKRGIQLGREAQLASYNVYREMCGFPRVTDFSQITGDADTQRELKQLYGTVDGIELYAGLYAEDVRENSALPALVGRIVGIDAFSQAFTNPLLSPSIFNEATFSPVGWKIVNTPVTLGDLVNRNTPPAPKRWNVTFYRGRSAENA
jgi:prostaglandin-endoperoxide synthase 2